MALRKMNADEFARRLQADSELQDKRFAFFLGAGCSITSGIPGAASLVKNQWLPKLRDFCAPDENDVDAWAIIEFPDYDKNNPADSYGPIMEKLFLQPEDRQREIERLCDGKFPGFGYAVLSTLIARDGGSFNVVITTNFDDLVSDALYLFTKVHPLVIGHESLAGFIRPTRTRPLIVKLHGDARLSPQNTAAETENLQKEVENQVKTLLHDRALIFLGYGGNDRGISSMLSGLPKDALPFGVYWINGDEPQGVLRSWLDERNAIWIEKFDFDEMMLLIRDAFELPHPDKKTFDTIFQKYTETYKKLSNSILIATDGIADEALKKAVDRADSDLSGWMNFALKAQRLDNIEPDEADRIYKEGIESYPNSAPLLNDYAQFLRNIRKDYDQAEIIFQRAIAADPNRARTLGNYAIFLHHIRKEYGQAKDFYLNAIQADPGDAYNLGAYALYLEQISKDYQQAEQFYQRAIENEPNEANAVGNSARLALSLGKKEKGNDLLEKTISLLPQSDTPGLKAEVWFYAFAHWPSKKRKKALTKLKEILLEGDRSPGWDLSANIAQARKDNHPDIDWVEKLAAVINEEEDISILDKWAAWKEA